MKIDVERTFVAAIGSNGASDHGTPAAAKNVVKLLDEGRVHGVIVCAAGLWKVFVDQGDEFVGPVELLPVPQHAAALVESESAALADGLRVLTA